MANAEEIFRVYDDKVSIFSTIDELNTQRKNSLFCDVMLKVFDSLYPVHSNVLAATSPYLSVFLSSKNPRNYSQSLPQLIELQIDDNESNEQYKKAVSNIIDYMYSGKLRVSSNCASKISHIAKILQMNKIVEYCSHFNQDVLQHSNYIQSIPQQEHITLNHSIINAEKLNFDSKNIINTGTGSCENDLLSSCDEEKESDAEADLLSPSTSLNKILSCNSCNYTTHSNYRLKRHMTIHSGGRYTCDVEQCSFSTLKMKNLTKHQNEHAHKMNICSFCSLQAESQEHLDMHLKLHTLDIDKPFFCLDCDKRFKNKTQLNLHTPAHSDFKPYVCEVCGTGFKWKHSLNSHKVIHTDEKNHLCDICGYATAHKSQLKAHKLIHTGETFKCPYNGCNFQAIKRNNLKYHMLTHTREKPHQCETCGQSFSLIKNLRRHKLLHAKEKPHHCDHCSFSTTRFDKLKDHLRRNHAIGLPPQKRVGPNHPPTVTSQLITNTTNVVSTQTSVIPTQVISVNTAGQHVQNLIIESLDVSNISNQSQANSLTIQNMQDTIKTTCPQQNTQLSSATNVSNILPVVEMPQSELLNLRSDINYFDPVTYTHNQSISSHSNIYKQ